MGNVRFGQALYPPSHYMRRVPQRMIHLFTGCQVHFFYLFFFIAISGRQSTLDELIDSFMTSVRTHLQWNYFLFISTSYKHGTSLYIDI